MDQDATGREVDIGPGDIVLGEDPPPKGAQPPAIFGPCFLWPNVWIDQDGTWYAGRPRSRRYCVRSGCSSAEKGAQHPYFSTHDRCGQIAGWVKIPLGTEVDLGPGHIMLDGHPAPPQKGHNNHSFQPISIVDKRSPISHTGEHLLGKIKNA